MTRPAKAKAVKAWGLFGTDGQSWWSRGKDGVCKHVTFRTRKDALEEAKQWIPVNRSAGKIRVVRVLIVEAPK